MTAKTDSELVASIRQAIAQMQQQRDKLTGAIEALQRVVVMYEPAVGAAREYLVGEAAKPTRPKEPCDICDKPYPIGVGMAAHKRWHKRNTETTPLKPPEPLQSDPELEPAPTYDCRFCSDPFDSQEARQGHEWTCPARLETRASVQHVHSWKLDPPKSGSSRGICKGCKDVQYFSDDPLAGKGQWNTKAPAAN